MLFNPVDAGRPSGIESFWFHWIWLSLPHPWMYNHNIDFGSEYLVIQSAVRLDRSPSWFLRHGLDCRSLELLVISFELDHCTMLFSMNGLVDELIVARMQCVRMFIFVIYWLLLPIFKMPSSTFDAAVTYLSNASSLNKISNTLKLEVD